MLKAGCKRPHKNTIERAAEMSEDNSTPTAAAPKRARASGHRITQAELDAIKAAQETERLAQTRRLDAVERDLERARATLRSVQRDVLFNDLRITNIPKLMANGNERDPRATYRTLLSEGLGIDAADVDKMCDPARIARCVWMESRSSAKGGGKNGGLNHVLFVRLTADIDVKTIFSKKGQPAFKNYKMGSDKPVSINRQFSADDRWDQIRCKEVALALCRKRGWDMRNAVKLMGNRFKANGQVKTYVEWIKEENLIIDPAKMGTGWVPPPGTILANSSASLTTPGPSTSAN